MLNNIKIRSKLTLGFGLMLLLLVSASGIGYYALKESIRSTNEMLVVNDLLSDMILYRRLLNTAQVHAVQGALFRDLTEEGARQKIDEEIHTLEESIKKRQVIPKNIELFDQLNKTYLTYVDEDSKWYRAEEERVIAQDALNKAGQSAGEQMENCIKFFHENLEASKKTVAGNEAVVDGAAAGSSATVDAAIAEQMFKVEDFAADLNLARRGFFAMMAEPDPVKTQQIAKDTQAQTDKLLADIKAFIPTVTGERRIAALNDAVTGINDWWAQVKRATELLNVQDGANAAKATHSDTMTSILQQLVDNLRERLGEIRAVSEKTDARMIWLMIGVAVFAIIVGIVLSYVIDHNITVGLSKAINDMQVVAGLGHLDLDINEEDQARKDEIGDMARGFEDIVVEFRNVENLAISLAQRNFDTSIKVRGEQDTMNINLNKMLDQVNIALQEVAEGVRQVATGSNEVSSAAQALSSGAQESAASLEEISASMNVISSQTKTNAESAAQARDLAHQASTAATNGQESMQAMTDAMGRITQNSNEIQRVIKVIDDIAFQTNLLALNAAVEAARAGQHGKGFAVVAEEVRNLASRSAKAAQETSELIAKSGQEIEKGGAVASKTADVLNTIVNQIKQTTDLVAGIAAASNEQAQGVNQITIGLQQIDSVTQQNTAAAEESASAANEMSSMARNLQELVGGFKLRNTVEGVKLPPPAVSKPVAPVAAKPTVKPAAKPAPAVKAKPAPSKNPSEPVADDKWGGGGNAEIQIDLDDKNFGKY